MLFPCLVLHSETIGLEHYIAEHDWESESFIEYSHPKCTWSVMREKEIPSR